MTINKQTYLSLLIGSVVLTTPATAQMARGIPSNVSTEKINRCLAIKSDPERLRCFETVTENSTFGDAIKELDPLEIIKKEAAERGEDVDLTIKKPEPVQKPKVEKPKVETPKVKQTKQTTPPKVETKSISVGKKPSAIDALNAAENTESSTSQDKVSKETKSNWETGVGKHPTTNLPVNFLYTYALETLHLENGQTSKPYLMLRCHNKIITAFVYWPNIYMGKKSVRTAYIIDKEAPVVSNWSVSTGGQSSGYFEKNGAIDFVKPMYKKFHLEVATRPQNKGQAITANFDISGLQVAIQPLTKSCTYLAED